MKKALMTLLIAGLCGWMPKSSHADQGEANKKLVLDFFRVVFEAQNVAAADAYLAPEYAQHNPLVATGRDGFVAFFSAKWKKAKPVEAALRNPPVMVMAEDDLVMLMWKVNKPEPSDKSKTYESFWFDVFRVKDGRLVEHWDNAVKK